MKRIILFIALLAASIGAYAYNNDSLLITNLQKEIESIRSEIRHQAMGIDRNRNELLRLNQSTEKLGESISALRNEMEAAGKQIQQHDVYMDSLAAKVGADIKAADIKIDQSGQTLSKRIQSRSWLSLAGILFAIALLLVLFSLLRKRISRGATTMDKIKSAQDELTRAQKALQEESIKLDSKLVELLNKQVETQPKENNSIQPDHSLVIKVADEIVRIETNLSHMDESVKGYRQLKRAVEHIRNNFLANGYEIVDMLGKPYNEGMKAVANFVTDDSLAEGERMITGVIKPQINYMGKMIQSAQITVSQNI